MANLSSTTAMPEYLFLVDTDHLNKRRDFDFIPVSDAQAEDYFADGTAVLDSTEWIGNFVGWFHHYGGEIDARPCVAMSLKQIVEWFGDIPHSVHLAWDMTLAEFQTATRYEGIVGDHTAIFTIEVQASPDDGYALLDQVAARLIHHDVWESAKNVAQPPAGGVI